MKILILLFIFQLVLIQFGNVQPMFICRFAKVEIEEGLEMIEDAFVSCPNLKTVIIPDSVKKLDEYEFRDCKDKVTLYVKKHSYAEKWAKKHKIKYAYGKPKEAAN